MGVVHDVLLQVIPRWTHSVQKSISRRRGQAELESVPVGTTGVLDTLLLGQKVNSLKVIYKFTGKV